MQENPWNEPDDWFHEWKFHGHPSIWSVQWIQESKIHGNHGMHKLNESINRTLMNMSETNQLNESINWKSINQSNGCINRKWMGNSKNPVMSIHELGQFNEPANTFPTWTNSTTPSVETWWTFMKWIKLMNPLTRIHGPRWNDSMNP